MTTGLFLMPVARFHENARAFGEGLKELESRQAFKTPYPAARTKLRLWLKKTYKELDPRGTMPAGFHS